MRKGSFRTAGLLLLLSFASARGQSEGFLPQGTSLQVGGFTDYITSARIYPAARDADPVIRTTYNSVGGFLAFGGDVRLLLPKGNAVGITALPISVLNETGSIYGYNSSGEYVGAPIKDGFNIWLFELTGYFNIPVVDDRWNLYLGGGPSIYFGNRKVQIGNAEANTPVQSSIGIQICAGVSYMFASQWGLRGEMKAVSPEFNTTSTFGATSTEYNGLKVDLPRTLYGKVDVNGTDFTLGFFYEF
ncbi:MAG: hypothetical protein M1469_00130 [Bacteroidetes bacterium]|nr:hypothetical protein [Bacteroidota bacterium]